MSNASSRTYALGTYVVRRIRVVVHATEERRRGVTADILREEVAAAGVVIEEGANVVDKASDKDQGALGGLLLDCQSRNGD